MFTVVGDCGHTCSGCDDLVAAEYWGWGTPLANVAYKNRIRVGEKQN